MAFGTCAARADTITDWNQTAIEVMKVANVAGNPWTRTLAMVHVAMSDAINSVQGRYTRYVTRSQPSRRIGGGRRGRCGPANPDSALSQPESHRSRRPTRHRSRLLPRASEERRHRARRAGRSSSAGRPRGRRHQRAGHLPPAHQPGVWVPTTLPLFAQYAQREALGAEERRPVPARPAAAFVQRALCPRLQ